MDCQVLKCSKYERLWCDELQNTELKPCMKCKSTNITWDDGCYNNFVIKCCDCGLQTPEICINTGEVIFKTYNEAAKWWNDRIGENNE